MVAIPSYVQPNVQELRAYVKMRTVVMALAQSRVFQTQVQISINLRSESEQNSFRID